MTNLFATHIRVALALFTIISATEVASAKTVILPVTLDYPMLKELIISRFFTYPGNTAVTLDENDGCSKITLFEPDIGAEGKHIRFGTYINVRTGTYIMDNCVMPVEWEGYIEIVQRPSFDSNGWLLKFETIDSRLYDVNRVPTTITGIVWELIKTHVHEYLDGIEVDLAPPVKGLQAFIPPLFPPELHDRAQKMMSGIRAGEVRIYRKTVTAEIIVEVEDHPEKEPVAPEKALSDDETEQFLKAWETWDSFLVFQISSMGGESLSEEERDTLLDILLETRIQFVTALGQKRGGSDLIREQFVAAWGSLAPILRKHLHGRSSASLLNYLAFFTASDALMALDKLGPSFGVEVSHDGLLRLARMLNRGEVFPLVYQPAINRKLRRNLGLGKPLNETSSFDSGKIPDGTNGVVDKWAIDLFQSFFIGTAWARKAPSLQSKNKYRGWLPSKRNLDFYMARVKSLLNKSAKKVLEKSSLDKKYHKFFTRLTLASAWQESCFRQFKVKRGKVTYLRSYNRSSVGLMQINERVWRGIYNRNSLRWDIRYNVAAGVEILELYLNRYAIRKMKRKKRKFSEETLARAVYAMYNGGPRQLWKFLKRQKRKKYYLSDKLFWQKYIWVKQGRWNRINKCLLGH